MAAIEESGIEKGKGDLEVAGKSFRKVDMVPIVDLGFLMITFSVIAFISLFFAPCGQQIICKIPDIRIFVV